MILIACLVSSAHGMHFSAPLTYVGGLFWGVDALVGSAIVPIIGLFVLWIVSGLLGLLFSALTPPRASSEGAFTAGILYGIGVWAFMTYLILPWADPTMYDRMALEPGWWFAENVVFGAVLAITPALRNFFARREGAGFVEDQERHVRRAA